MFPKWCTVAKSGHTDVKGTLSLSRVFLSDDVVDVFRRRVDSKKGRRSSDDVATSTMNKHEAGQDLDTVTFNFHTLITLPLCQLFKLRYSLKFMRS